MGGPKIILLYRRSIMRSYGRRVAVCIKYFADNLRTMGFGYVSGYSGARACKEAAIMRVRPSVKPSPGGPISVQTC